MKILLYCAFLLIGVTTSLPAQDEERRREVAQFLWDDFLAVYEKHALQPMDAKALDLKAREALIAALGVKFRTWDAGRAESIMALIDLAMKEDPKFDAYVLIEKVLQRLMREIDKYGKYETQEEKEQMDLAQQQSASGIYAIRLDMDDKGLIRCYPDPDGPGSKAGVLAGAVLLEVDGVDMRQKSLAHAKLAFVGGESVQLKIRQPQGLEAVVPVKRSQEDFPSVRVTKTAGGVRLRIRDFQEGTAKAIKEAMAAETSINRLTIDLRGNPGGIITEAFLAASLFLPEGAVIAYVKDREQQKPFKDGNPVLIAPQSINILMDQGSASAAELLAISLRIHMPDQVKLYGETSYGKSYRLFETQLRGGGMLTLTDGMILGPDEKPWSATGIVPDVKN